MPRDVKPWVGRNDNAMPPRSVFDRLWEKQDGKDAITGLPFTSKDKVIRDHIVPLKDGGKNVESNLQLITEEAHKTKTGEEATARAKERRIHERARGYQRRTTPSFQTNRNSKFKKRMDGTLVLRATGEPVT